jgi:hypothetical protein
MRLVRVKEHLTFGGHIHLHHLTDLHAGDTTFCEEELKERIELINSDKDARWTFGGDSGALIRHNDRRYEPSSLHPRYRQATDLRLATREHIVELFDPIKDKLWGWCDGNHEAALDRFSGGHFGLEVCCDLGMEDKWVDYRGFVHAQCHVTKTNYLAITVDLQHGWQSGRLKGAAQVQAERELGYTDADVVLRGHNHQASAHTWVTLGVNKMGTIATRMRTVLNGGSWMRGYLDNPAPVNRNKLSEVEKAGWTERKGYRPEPVGGPVLRLTFDPGRSRTGGGDGRPQTPRPSGVVHTTIEGHIDARVLGLEQ